MKTSKILNTAAICLLAMGFNGNNVSCTNLNGSQEPAAANPVVSTPGNDAQQAGTQQGGANSKSVPEQQPQQAAGETTATVVVKTLDVLRGELRGQREAFLSEIIKSDGPFTILQLVGYLRVVDTDLLLKVDSTKVDEAGKKVKAYLEKIGIRGDSVEAALDNLMIKVYEITKGTVESSAQGTDSEELKTLLLKFSEDLKAEQELHSEAKGGEALLSSMKTQHDELLKKFAALTPTFLTSEDISGYLTVPEYGAPMNAAKWKKVEGMIHGKLESSEVPANLKALVAELIELREQMMDLLYGPIGHHDCAAGSGQGSSPKKPSFAAVPSSLSAIVFGIIVSMF
uniref:Erythrocyte-binding protein Bd37 n=2 Tax=Babesia divergens TaxID=32595 RepID=BD37_BABDI|nr:glycosylphosphatidylinositol-anchored merozoite surface protein [Babesia divergens]